MVPCTRYQWDALQKTAEANGWTPFVPPDQLYQTRPFTVLSPLFPDTILTHELGAFVSMTGFIVAPSAPNNCSLTYDPGDHELVSGLTSSTAYFVSWFMTPDSQVIDPPEATLVVFSRTGGSPSFVTSYAAPHHGQGYRLQFTFPAQSTVPSPSAVWISGSVTQFALSDEPPPVL
jgi:hypothetical protein